MSRYVEYEWDVETYFGFESDNPEDHEIADHDHDELEKLLGYYGKDCLTGTGQYRLVLVRDAEDEDRSWAYVIDGVLPEFFTNANLAPVGKVTKPYRTQFDKAVRNLK